MKDQEFQFVSSSAEMFFRSTWLHF